MTPADVLDEAATYIDQHGWTQGHFSRVDGSVCAVGAICRTPSTLAEKEEACDAFRERVGAGVFGWNDAEHRTKEQVVKELRACAADLREQA